MKKTPLFFLFIVCLFFISCETELELNDEKKIESFDIYSKDLDYSFIGEISDQDLSIQVSIPQEMNIKLITPTIKISEGAEIFPPSDVLNDFSGGAVYTVTAENGTVANYYVTLNQKSSSNEIFSFKLPDLSIEAEIVGDIVKFTVTFGTDLSSVLVEFIKDSKSTSSFESGNTINFEEIKEITIISELGIERTYTFEVTITPASDENKLISFSLPDYFVDGVISGNTIIFNLLYGTELSEVSFTIDHSDFSTTSLDGTEKLNLNTLSLVTITSQSGKEKEYVVKVNIAEQETGVRGVWLTNVASNVLTSRQNISNAMDLLSELNFNTVFLVTWNKTQTPHPSKVLKDAISSLNNSEIITQFDPDRDILQEVIEEAHSRNIKVIAWFEYGFASQYGSANNGMNYVLQANPHWSSKDINGNIASKNGFYWMNAFHPEVQNFMIDLILEVVENYDVDGIQGDDRLPAVTSSSGYDEYTVSRYKAEHDGNSPPSSAGNSQWIDWRANILSDFAQNLYSKVKESDPECLVTFSPSPYSFSLTSYLQDWPKWVDNNIVQIISPQLYRRDTDGFSNYSWLFNVNFNYANNNKKIFYPGVLLQIGNYVPSDDFLIQMIRHHRSKGVFGEVFFFFEGVDDKKKVFQALYPGEAIFPDL